MKDYVLNKKPEPASNEIVWAFDLGKGSIGDFPSPRWGDLSRLGNGERSLAKPKAGQGRVIGRERVKRQCAGGQSGTAVPRAAARISF
jgi:hypothetical protein